MAVALIAEFFYNLNFCLRFSLPFLSSGPGIPELFFPKLFFPELFFSELFCMWRHNFSFMTSFLPNYDVITKMITPVFLVLLTFRVIWSFSTRFFFRAFNFSSYLIDFNSGFFRTFNFSSYMTYLNSSFFRAFNFSSYLSLFYQNHYQSKLFLYQNNSKM